MKATWFAALLLAFSLAVPAFSGAGRTAFAQEPQPPQSSSAPAEIQKNRRPLSEAERKERLLEEEEEGEVDPNEVFKHSSPVRWISRKTGLSIGAAFWLCMAVNFLVVVLVLRWFLTKVIPVPAIFRNRFSAIQQRLEDARKTSEEARQRLTEVEARLSRLDTEIEQTRRRAESSTRHEEEKVKADVEEERRRIVDSAEQEIARAASAARRELKAYTAELGVNLAEKKIRIEEGADERLVRDFALRLGRDGN